MTYVSKLRAHNRMQITDSKSSALFLTLVYPQTAVDKCVSYLKKKRIVSSDMSNMTLKV